MASQSVGALLMPTDQRLVSTLNFDRGIHLLLATSNASCRPRSYYSEGQAREAVAINLVVWRNTERWPLESVNELVKD